ITGSLSGPSTMGADLSRVGDVHRKGPTTDVERGNVMSAEHFLRFERASAVEATDRGLAAQIHGELRRLDVVRADIVRVKISRGGTFDESPTFAVCVDPLGEDVGFTVERADDVVRLRTSDLVVSLRCTSSRNGSSHSKTTRSEVRNR